VTWERFAPKSPRANAIPHGAVGVSPTLYGVTFGRSTVEPWGLKRFKTVNVLTDGKLPSVIAFQFCQDGVGDYSCDRKTDCSSLSVHCTSLLKEKGVSPGRYSARLDKPGFVIVDFGLPVR